MFGIKKKEKATVKVNVGKAVALVATDDQDYKTRKITRVGYTQDTPHGQYVVTGHNLISAYLSEHQTLLRDDNDQWFPVSRIRNIIISNEDFFCRRSS